MDILKILNSRSTICEMSTIRICVPFCQHIWVSGTTACLRPTQHRHQNETNRPNNRKQAVVPLLACIKHNTDTKTRQTDPTIASKRWYHCLLASNATQTRKRDKRTQQSQASSGTTTCLHQTQHRHENEMNRPSNRKQAVVPLLACVKHNTDTKTRQTDPTIASKQWYHCLLAST